jgi:hypothetical protein
MAERQLLALLATILVMHLAVGLVSEEESFDALNPDLMETAVINYRRHKLQASEESHEDLLMSLLEVTENVSSMLGAEPEDLATTAGWRFGQSEKGDFAFTYEGDPMAFIKRDGEVWGAKAGGYLMREAVASELADGSTKMQGGQDTKIGSGRWNAGMTTDGSLGFFNQQGTLVALINAEGKLWGSKESGFFDGDDTTQDEQDDTPKPSITKDIKQNSAVSLGDWTIGEDAQSGDFVFLKGNDLKAYIDREGRIFAIGQSDKPLRPREHATRDPGTIVAPIDTQEKDCLVANWGEFSKCTLPCGGGKRTRTRKVISASRNGGAECPVLKESRSCLRAHADLNRCPNDCQVSEWSSWGECSKQCGGGHQFRIRNVTKFASSRGRPCPDVKEYKPCNVALCGVELCKHISSAFALNLNKPDEVIVAAQDRWVMYQTTKSVLVDGPHKLSDEHGWFESLPLPFSSQIDGSFTSTKGTSIYLFSHGHDDQHVERSQWLLYDTINNEIEKGPYSMRVGPFSTLGAPFNLSISAAVNRGFPEKNEAFLFSGNQWLLYDLDSASIVEGPYQINSGPSLNLPSPFNHKVDAAISEGVDRAVLFSGAEWLVWDSSLRQVLDGPFLISVHPRFSPLVAALDLCTGYDLRQLGDMYQRLEAIRPQPSGITKKIAGTIIPGHIDSSNPAEAQFNKPSGIAVVGRSIYAADSANNAIRRIDQLTMEVTTIAGGQNITGFKDGRGEQARFNSPTGITGAAIKNAHFEGDLLFVADRLNHAIRRIWIPKGELMGIVSTVAGGGAHQCNECGGGSPEGATDCMSCCSCASEAMGFRDDQDGRLALFAQPTGVAIAFDNEVGGEVSQEAAGKNEVVYVADSMNHAIRQLIIGPGKIHAEVSTVAGGQKYGVSMEGYRQTALPQQWGHGFGSPGCADGMGSDAMFNNPHDVAVLKHENKHVLYVADSGNNRVARVEINVKLEPTSPMVQVPVLVLKDVHGKQVGIPDSVPPGTEYQWDQKEQLWTDPSASIDSAASVCPLKHKLTAPSTVEMVLGGNFNIKHLAFEWAPDSGPKDYQLSTSADGKVWHTAFSRSEAPNAVMEHITLPISAQKLSAGFVRLSSTTLHSDRLVLDSLRVMGVMTDSNVTTDTSASQFGPESKKSCIELGWRPSASADELMSHNVCGSSHVGSDGGCLSFERHSEETNSLVNEGNLMTWHEADQTCESLGARLCTIEEIQASVPAQGGCNMDNQRVWSSTQCGCGGVFSQAAKIGVNDPMSIAPRECSRVGRRLSVQCCADGPPAHNTAPDTISADLNDQASLAREVHINNTNKTSNRRLLQQPAGDAAGDQSSVTANSLPALQEMRFTNGDGTAQPDEECCLPFVFDGLAYNNCTTEGTKENAPHGWCPVAGNTAVAMQGNIMSVTEHTKWGACHAPGYIPPKCVLSPWQGWGTCTALCGGGTKTRHRRVLENSGNANLCGETTQVMPCNIHECGFVETIAGGLSGRSHIGIGFADSPFNPESLRRKQTSEPTPDLAFNPWSITVIERDGADVIFATGEPRSRADHVSLVRQIEVSPVTEAEKGGAGGPENCLNIDDASPGEAPLSTSECRLLTSGYTSEVVGNGFPSRGAVSVAVTSESRLYSALGNHQIREIEMHEHVKCESWMSTKLNLWEVPTDEPAQISAPILLSLKTSQFSPPTTWKFEAIRQVGSLKSLGLNADSSVQHTYSKNQLCSTLQGHGPQSTVCCLFKEVQGLAPPEKCQKPVTAECASVRKVEVLDYEYGNKVLASSSWA